MTGTCPLSLSVTNVNITNPIVIENMTDSKISQSTDITVNGNDNTVVANSKGAKINNDKKI